MPPDQDQHDDGPHPAWKSMSAQEENHAFILRVRLAGTPERVRQAQFTVEEVGARSRQRFATFPLAIRWLGERIDEIIPGQVEERDQP